jgi:predicted ribosomally synthesized peptide with nif11-like leader
MSVEAVHAFWEMVRQEPALQEQLRRIQSDSLEASSAAVARVAAAAGFTFTAREYAAAVQEELARRHAGGQLSEEQLEQAAGGYSSGGIPIGSAPASSVQS